MCVVVTWVVIEVQWLSASVMRWEVAVTGSSVPLSADVKFRLRGFRRSDKTLAGMTLSIIKQLASQPSEANVVLQYGNPVSATAVMVV